MERREADPIHAREYGAERREVLERRGAALMGYDNDRREAPRIKELCDVTNTAPRDASASVKWVVRYKYHRNGTTQGFFCHVRI